MEQFVVRLLMIAVGIPVARRPPGHRSGRITSVEAFKRRWASLDELNCWLAERCRALWSEIAHPEHSQFSIAEMLEHERGQANLFGSLGRRWQRMTNPARKEKYRQCSTNHSAIIGRRQAQPERLFRELE